MNKPRTLALWVSVLVAVVCLSGCGGILSSFQFDDRVLVKLPGDNKNDPASTQVWGFKHVVEAPKKYPGDWYLVWEKGRPPSVHLSFPWSRWVYAREHALSVARECHEAFGVYPLMIEPDYVFTRAAARVEDPAPLPDSPSDDSAAVPAHLQVRALPSEAWPYVDDKDGIDVAWYQDDDHTQLRTAVEKTIGEENAGRGIRIGILDDGFSAGQAGVPDSSHIQEDADGDAMGTLVTYGHPVAVAPGGTGATHGTGTIGILAGRKVCIQGETVKGRKIKDFCGYIGGVPNATIIPVRISPWVVSLTTANMAYGIDYASRRRSCDVISISNGGEPCEIWVDAVNAAYDRGTAMFAAEGDFYSVLCEPFQPRGIIVPASPVYPSSFRTVMGVTGVTADGNSYAENTLGSLLAHPFAFGQWIARGSYGPKASWNSAFGINDTPDTSTVNHQGLLRAYPIAAYSPNIPWLVAATKGDTTNNEIDLDGSGTSAATPQVAAAAALWLGAHRKEFKTKEDWHSWKKVEAVYDALLMSANRKENKTWPDLYLGAGTLKANDALKISLKQIEDASGHEVFTGSDHLTLKYVPAPGDHYDGDRSFLGLLGLTPTVCINCRADLDQRQKRTVSEEQELTRLFYNTLLLEEWHAGRLPLGEKPVDNFRDNLDLEKRAERLAQDSLKQT